MAGATAIIGAGLVAKATAACLAHEGREVALWSPSGRSAVALRERADADGRTRLRYRGALEGEAEIRLIDDPVQIESFETLIVALPADGYAAVLRRVLPHIRSDHRVIFSGALSLVPLWLHERAGGGSARPLVVSWGTTVATARRSSAADVELGTIRKRFDAAVVPAVRRDEGLALCRDLFGDRFDPADGILATALSNVNPVAHAAEALPNLTRMERGESWYLFDCLTPSAARVAQAIDDERLRIAQAFGISVRTLAMHYHLSYHVPPGSLAQMAAAIHARDRAPLGPRTLEHRYILEDFPYGLSFYERLAAIAGIAVPVTSAAITFACAAYARDLRADNAILADLALDRLDPVQVLARCAG